jgi:predicted O-methyltransferase YrrM
MEDRVETYLHGILPKRDAVLTEMETYARRHGVPIIGPAVGRIIYLLAQASSSQRVFELGSAIGYSTIWLARAVGPNGEVYYTDSDSVNAQRAQEYFRRAGVDQRIRILVGDAVDMLDRVSGVFDLVFIDVDKHQYPAALRKALPRLRKGGLLLADNVLWHDRVVSGARDVRTRAIRQFNKMIYASRELFPAIIPLRDGVAVCRKA